MSSGTSARSLTSTPTWAVATVIFVFIALSIFIEQLIHLLCSWLKRKRKTSLFEAVEKLKSVLILLGFLSLLLAVTQRPISRICVPNSVSNTMLPCSSKPLHTTGDLGLGFFWPSDQRKLEESRDDDDDDNDHKAPPPPPDDDSHNKESSTTETTASEASSDHCESKGMTALISEKGVNQLSIFIFVLAVTQILYGVLTMGLGRAKMKRWKAWERETQTVEYQAANDDDNGIPASGGPI